MHRLRNYSHPFHPLVRSRGMLIIEMLFFISLLVLVLRGDLARWMNAAGHALALSLFDSRAPNPVPDVAPPVRQLQNSPALGPDAATPAQLARLIGDAPSLDPALTDVRARWQAALSRFIDDKLKSPADSSMIPVYNAFDLTTGYLTNLTYPAIVDGTPWDFGSVNLTELNSPGGGTTYWDYWSEEIPWDSPNHGWRDDAGQWHPYATETILDSNGQAATAYVLLERRGPGVMDKLWFTHDPTNSFMGVLLQSSLMFWSVDSPEVAEWGSLEKLGNLRIEVDGNIVYDGPIKDWFSGQAQSLPADLRRLMAWHYRQMGSDGNIIPIAYQDHLKVWTYGGKGKPKWFMATGMSLPPTTRVQPYTGRLDDLSDMDALAQTILAPEDDINVVGNRMDYNLDLGPGTPAVVNLGGSGTLASLQFRLPKKYDPRDLSLRVYYGKELGIDVPLLAFFSEPDQLFLHHSSPIGVIDDGDNYLFYSNMPMPYQNGISIELSTSSEEPVDVAAQLATLPQTWGTQLRAAYRAPEKLTVYGPDFQVNVPGNGKLVALTLVTGDQDYSQVPPVIDPKTGKEDNAKKIWPMGYLEGNLTLKDGAGNARYYSGQEDWAEGGYYFNSGYTTPPGGANMPFAGILRYQGGRNGFATLFRYFNDLSAFRFKDGLQLAFGHGTWNNNFPASYSATVLYYAEIGGSIPARLPASNYIPR